MYERSTVMVACILLVSAVPDRTYSAGSNLHLRLGEAAYVAGSTRVPFIRLHIENEGSEVEFVDLPHASKIVTLVGADGEHGRATAKVKDVDHNAKLCVALDDVVAIESGKSVVALAALPVGATRGRATVVVRMHISTSSLLDLCAVWTKKTIEANGTVVLPDAPSNPSSAPDRR